MGTRTHLTARDVMSAPVQAARPDWPVARAAELLERCGFTALPVVDGQEHLAGVVGGATSWLTASTPVTVRGTPSPTS
jgi:CBS-domain-containing membrane protein